MLTRFALLTAVLCGSFAAAVPAADEAPAKARILFVTQSEGFRHSSVTRKEGELSPAEIAITQLGDDSGVFTVHCTQEVQVDFTKENLQNYDIVAFYTTGKLPIADADLEYFFNEWLKQPGHGVLGFHSARRHVPCLRAVFHDDRRDVHWASLERGEHGDAHQSRT